MAGLFGDTQELPKKKIKKKKKDTKLGTGLAENARKKLKGRAAQLEKQMKEAGI
jgi:hypothetical protein